MCWSRVDRSYGSWSYDDRHSTVDAAPPATEFRVSDKERQDVIDQLRHHTGEGRLTLDEFESRLDEVMQAKTGGDLQNALRELPPQQTRRPATRSSFPGIPVPFLILGVVLVLSLAASHAAFWLIIPFCFIWTSGRRRRHYRPHRPDPPPDPDRRDDILTPV